MNALHDQRLSAADPRGLAANTLVSPFARATVVCFAGWALQFSSAHAQLVQLKPGEVMPAFDVAAIRPNNSGSGREHIWHNDNSWRVENLALRDLIRRAWGAASNSQVIGGSDPLFSQRFDINAKISDANTARLAMLSSAESNRQVNLMLQSLLTDRFNLKVHIETKELPAFALVIAKSGAKFHPSLAVPSAIPGKPPEPHTSFTVRASGSSKEVEVTNHTLQSTLVMILGLQPETEGRPVLDETDMTGTYDFNLKWTTESLVAGAKPGDNSTTDPSSEGLSLFTALEDQLGLKLESEKAHVEVLVVDHVEPPSAN